MIVAERGPREVHHCVLDGRPRRGPRDRARRCRHATAKRDDSASEDAEEAGRNNEGKGRAQEARRRRPHSHSRAFERTPARSEE